MKIRITATILIVLLATSMLSNTVKAEVFDGNSFIEIPSTDSLKLETFNIIAKVKIPSIINNRMFIVSKGSEGDTYKDQNYAIFVTKNGKVNAGFKDINGEYYYISSDIRINDDNWHSIKAVYNGYKLKLIVDDNEVIQDLKTTPEISNKPLIIGANSNTKNNQLVGEISSLIIRNHKSWDIVYELNNNRDRDRDSNEDNCSNMPLSKFVGVVFIDPVLTARENKKDVQSDNDYITRSFAYLKKEGFTGIRVPLYWESYVGRPNQFINQLKFIAEEAKKNSLCIIWDNHHYYTTSVWKVEKKGRGFPSFAVKNYPSPSDGKYSTVAKQFWTDLLNNKIVINGTSLWDHQVKFLTLVINTVKPYGVTKGLEILNEPHIWDIDQYQKLGEYNTYITKKLREKIGNEITLIMNRENMKNGQRQPDMEYLIIPKGVSNIAYGPHLYSLPCTGCQGEKQLNNFKQWSQDWGVQIYIGEFSHHSQDEANTFISKFKSYGFGWTAWKMSKKVAGEDNRGVQLYVQTNGKPNDELQQLIDAYKEFY